MKPTKVLMVCLGNICRSPTAHGVFQHLVEREGLSHVIFVDSAGTSGWHIDEPPDRRSQNAALSRGYDLSQQRGRQVQASDFETFDYILAMDQANLDDLRRMRPKAYSGHLGLFLAFSKEFSDTEVPDPYHGGAKGFELVLDMVESAAVGLLYHIKQTRV